MMSHERSFTSVQTVHTHTSCTYNGFQMFSAILVVRAVAGQETPLQYARQGGPHLVSATAPPIQGLVYVPCHV